MSTFFIRGVLTLVTSQSCRWVFKQLYDKGLVYRGFKVVCCFNMRDMSFYVESVLIKRLSCWNRNMQVADSSDLPLKRVFRWCLILPSVQLLFRISKQIRITRMSLIQLVMLQSLFDRLFYLCQYYLMSANDAP